MAILCSVTVAMFALIRGMLTLMLRVHHDVTWASLREDRGVRLGTRRTSANVNPVFMAITDKEGVNLSFIIIVGI